MSFCLFYEFLFFIRFCCVSRVSVLLCEFLFYFLSCLIIKAFTSHMTLPVHIGEDTNVNRILKPNHWICLPCTDDLCTKLWDWPVWRHSTDDVAWQCLRMSVGGLVSAGCQKPVNSWPLISNLRPWLGGLMAGRQCRDYLLPSVVEMLLPRGMMGIAEHDVSSSSCVQAL